MLPSSVLERSCFAAADADARIRWLIGGTPEFDPAAPAGPFTTLVAYLPPPFAARIDEFVGRLPALSSHYRYAPGQLHVTIRNLNSANVAHLGSVVAGKEPIRLTAAGLGFTRASVLVRLFVTDGTLGRIRRELDCLKVERPRPHWLRGLVFANVMRLNGPVDAALRHSISRHRKALCGEIIELDELTLVHTDKVCGPDSTEVLARYGLRSASSVPRC